MKSWETILFPVMWAMPKPTSLAAAPSRYGFDGILRISLAT